MEEVGFDITHPTVAAQAETFNSAEQNHQEKFFEVFNDLGVDTYERSEGGGMETLSSWGGTKTGLKRYILDREKRVDIINSVR